MNMIIDSRKDIVMNKKGGIFAVAGRAKQRISELGKENVVNSTLGNGMDEQGSPFIIPTFIRVVQDLVAQNGPTLCGYTPPGGLPALNQSYPEYILQGVDLPEDVVVKATTTHGGSGGLTLSIVNMAPESVISHLPYWPNYNLIAKQNGRKIKGFNLLDENLNFDIASFAQTIQEMAQKEGRLFLMINSPYSNPTGSSITDDEWQSIGQELAKYDVPTTVLLDLAYVDFGQGGKDPAALQFIPKLMEKAPKANLVLVPSASKAFMAYGWRLGAAILLTRDAEGADEWFNVMEGTTRGSNSNNTTAPQQALAKIFADPKLTKAAEQERQEANEVIQSRFQIFSEQAQKAGIKISKPTGGYFTMVYAPNAQNVAAKLEEQNIFTVPIGNPEGLRISICSLTKEECQTLPSQIASVL